MATSHATRRNGPSLAAQPRILVLRLVPGQDLLAGLRRAVAGAGSEAACVLTCVGSLTSAVLRLAGGDEVRRLRGPFEVVSLVGTLGAGGEHLHVSLADRAGAVTGGHVKPGCRVYTTAEVALALLDDLSFAREPCPRSGWDELVVRARGRVSRGRGRSTG